MIQRSAIDRTKNPPRASHLLFNTWGTTMETKHLFFNELSETIFCIFGIFLLGLIVGVAL